MASPLAPSTPIPGVTDNGSVAAGNYAEPGSILDRAKNGKQQGLPNNGLTPATDLPNTLTAGAATPVTSVADFLGKLSNVYLWKRIGVVAVGVLLVWWGVLIFLASNKKIQGAVTSTAKKIISGTPQGAAANVATGAVGL
jgi:hypothetical protein